MSLIQTFAALGYTVKATLHDYRVEYVIYEIAATDGDGMRPMYQNEKEEYVYSIDEAEVFAHGHVKWDGCSNWMFDDCTKNMMIHGCCREDIENIGKILAECWDWTERLLPNFYVD
jgi:hypothetical protein